MVVVVAFYFALPLSFFCHISGFLLILDHDIMTSFLK